MEHTRISPAEPRLAPIMLSGALPPPPPAVTCVLSRYSREELSGFIAVAIDLLDLAEPDPDLEDGDEDGQFTEDEISTNLEAQWGHGPGCPIADPDMACDDVPCDEPYQDCEPEELIHAAYGIDQSRGPLPPHVAGEELVR